MASVEAATNLTGRLLGRTWAAISSGPNARDGSWRHSRLLSCFKDNMLPKNLI